ncbi:hypothetical protein AU106_gp218 [Sinorhizobium phage phiM9]|uniref:Uncharacterized protein n=1 Tax=Sinorhizobium phage phiM9 TaxID=1636182 RepID=A0A0F6TGQ9_9CAUD|nr:hypothetical protein AU106_gp218 [Sinorhizobium phage phiM9]AKE44849.1 hypothetical protein Sm_phiM9_222 [Sinorhizobium phage phiM9]
MMYRFFDFFEHLVKTSEVRAKVDPRTFWYLPKGSKIEDFFELDRTDYTFINLKTTSLNQAKELLRGAKKVAILSYMDKKGSSILANEIRATADVIIEFCEHYSEDMR